MATTPSDKHLLTIDDVCRLLGESRDTIYKWRAKGRCFPCIRLPNGSLRVRPAELEAWLDELGDVA